MLQPLVDRRLLAHRWREIALNTTTFFATVFALPVLSEHVSLQGAGASFALWWGREHRAFSNFLLSLLFCQLFEVVGLLARRYSLVDV